MFARKEHQEAPKHLPDTWKEDINQLLENTYKKDKDSFFQIHTELYPSELVLIVSIMPNEIGEASVSCFVSSDTDKKKDTKKQLDSMLDLCGVFLDSYFKDPDHWSDWEPTWQKTNHNDQDFFYKITRENISLSLEAELLLKKSLQ